MGWYAPRLSKIHFDYHTPVHADVVAKSFDAEAFAERLSGIGCEVVYFFAKDVFGNCYWDTKVGFKHPHLRRDLLGEVVEAAGRRGIKVVAYYNALDLINAKRHPEWRHKGSEGVPGSEGFYVCFNSPWLEEVFFPELGELLEYGIAGLFFDFLYVQQPCFCDWCEARHRGERGAPIPRSPSDPGWPRYLEWWRGVGEEVVKRTLAFVKSRRPDVAVGVNWAYTPRQPGEPPPELDYLVLDPYELDCPVLNISYHARYWEQFGKPRDVYVSRFALWWGDYGFKPPDELLAECATALANGAAFIFGDHLYVDGSCEPAALELAAKAFRFAREREALLGSRSVPCVAVLQSLEEVKRSASVFADDAPLRGAHKALVELGLHHDILIGERAGERIFEYELVVLPEQKPSPELAELLSEYVRRGGALLATFSAAEGLEELLGVELREHARGECGYVVPLPELGFATPVFVRGRFARVEARGARVLATRADPYAPPEAEGLPYEDWLGAGRGSPVPTGEPAACAVERGKGRAAYVAAELFRCYRSYQSWWIAELLRRLLDWLVPAKRFERVRPRSVEASLRRAPDGSYLVHLVNWHAARGYALPAHAWELEPVEAEFRLRLDGEPASVEVLPKGAAELEWRYRDGVLEARVRGLRIHAAVRVAP